MTTSFDPQANDRAPPDYRAGCGRTRRRHCRTGAGRAWVSPRAGADFRAGRLHRADHGGTPGRHDDHRGLRERVARACRRCSTSPTRSSAPIGWRFPRPGIDRPLVRRIGLRAQRRRRASRSRWRSRSRGGGGFAACCSASRATPRGCAATTSRRMRPARCCCRSRTWRTRSVVLTDTVIAQSLKRGKTQKRHAAEADDLDAAQDHQADATGLRRQRPSPRQGVAAHQRGRLTDGRQRQPARTAADRRRGRPRESDRPRHRHRRHGGCDPEGGPLALWRRDRGARGDQPEDRRDAAVAPVAGGR